MADRYILKVLSGVHLGAEADFGSEGLVVGKGEDCDVVLSDQLLAPQHFRLAIEGDKVVLHDLGGAVLRGSHELSEGSTVTPYEVLLAGGVRFAVGAADSVWPPLVFPETEVVPQQNPPEESAKQTESDPPATEETPKKSSSLTPVLLVVALLIVCVIAGVTVLTSKNSVEVLIDEDLYISAKQAMQNQVDKLAGLHDLEFAWREGQLNVTGRMQYESELLEIRRYARTHEIPVNFDVICWDIMMDRARNIVSLYRIDWVIEPIGLTGMRIDGYMSDQARSRRVIADIVSSAGQIDPLEINVLTMAEARASIQQVLNSSGLQQLLRLEEGGDGDNLSIKGMLPLDYSARWNELYQDINKKLPNIVIHDGVRLASGSEIQTALFGSPVAAVHFGEIDYIMLANSRILMAGARTPSGWMLEKISPEKLVVRNGNFSLDLTLTL